MIELRLSYPVSANRYWRNFRGRMVRSSEATAYRRHVTQVADQLGIIPMPGPVRLEVELLPKITLSGAASAVVLDLDNCLKVVGDALQGIAYQNDKQIKSIRADYGEPVKDGGLRVKISAI
jgi:crossover junction endodeoxyribonuclease RusA